MLKNKAGIVLLGLSMFLTSLRLFPEPPVSSINMKNAKEHNRGSVPLQYIGIMIFLGAMGYKLYKFCEYTGSYIPLNRDYDIIIAKQERESQVSTVVLITGLLLFALTCFEN